MVEGYNPYAAPDADLAVPTDVAQREYGGLRRAPYFLAALGIGIVNGIAIQFPETPPVILVQLAVTVAGVWLAVLRLRNIGANPWWALLFIVPLANVIFGIYVLAVPTGYADHRKMDPTGWIVIGIVVAAILLMLLAILFPLLAM